LFYLRKRLTMTEVLTIDKPKTEGKLFLVDIRAVLKDGINLAFISNKTGIHLQLLCKYTSKDDSYRSDPKLDTLVKIAKATKLPLKSFIVDYIPDKDKASILLTKSIGYAKKAVKAKNGRVLYTDIFGVLGKNISIKDLSKITLINQQSLYLYGSLENRQRIDPTLKTLKRISDATGVPLKRFIVDYIPK